MKMMMMLRRKQHAGEADREKQTADDEVVAEVTMLNEARVC